MQCYQKKKNHVESQTRSGRKLSHEVHFDNLTITGDSVPDMDVITGVSSKHNLANTWGQMKTSK